MDNLFEFLMSSIIFKSVKVPLELFSVNIVRYENQIIFVLGSQILTYSVSDQSRGIHIIFALSA